MNSYMGGQHQGFAQQQGYSQPGYIQQSGYGQQPVYAPQLGPVRYNLIVRKSSKFIWRLMDPLCSNTSNRVNRTSRKATAAALRSGKLTPHSYIFFEVVLVVASS